MKLSVLIPRTGDRLIEQSIIRRGLAEACVSRNSLFSEINFVCFTLSCLVFGADTAATWKFNGSEIRALKTARSHKRTNQSGIKLNSSRFSQSVYRDLTAAVARWYWLMRKRVSIPRDRYTSLLPLNYLIAETRQISESPVSELQISNELLIVEVTLNIKITAWFAHF